TINGRMFMVPDIRDRNTKTNNDIRRVYGSPQMTDAAGNTTAPPRDAAKPSESSGAETRTTAPNAPAAVPRGQARLHAPAEALAFAALCIPFAVVFLRERRKRKIREK